MQVFFFVLEPYLCQVVRVDADLADGGHFEPP
jgi:hypothetical protein